MREEQEKLPTPTHCEWCGAKIRKGVATPGADGTRLCPRGSMCHTEQSNHEDLLNKLKEAK